MFIINSDAIKINTYMCGSIVAKYLINKGFSVLSLDINTEKFVFSKTDSLILELKNAPFWVKILA